jgi:hypothetical protein
LEETGLPALSSRRLCGVRWMPRYPGRKVSRSRSRRERAGRPKSLKARGSFSPQAPARPSPYSLRPDTCFGHLSRHVFLRHLGLWSVQGHALRVRDPGWAAECGKVDADERSGG